MLPPYISDSIIRLIINEPFYAHILSSLNTVVTNQVPTAGVSMSMPLQLLINPDFFEQITPLQRIGVLKHEVLHLVMEHFVRRDQREVRLWNVACDLAVNSLLPHNCLPCDAITVESMNAQLNLTLLPNQSAETYYDLLKDKVQYIEIHIVADNTTDNKSGLSRIQVKLVEKSGKEANFSGQNAHPDVIDSDIDNTTREILQEAIRDIVKRASQSCGDVPAFLHDYIAAMDCGKINWRRVLARFLLGRGKMIAVPTYMRESRRYDLFPGHRKQIGMEALVAIDTSGSMSTDMLREILGQLLKIKKISGTRIWVTWGDMQQTGGPIPLEKVGTKIKFTGRGGTDLCWPFQLASKMRLPTVVYCTDGYGPAPRSVPQKVLWVLTANGRKPAVYGMEVRLNN